jgi:hypothetical protein
MKSFASIDFFQWFFTFYVTKDKARAIPSLGKGSLFLFSLIQYAPPLPIEPI